MDNSVKREYETLGKEILDGVRNELLAAMRFLELAFPMTEPSMNLSTFYIGTDGKKLYYNPRFLAQRYRQDAVKVNRSYVHLLLHGLFGHIYKDKKEEGDDFDRELWNLSCDVTAEYIIDHMDIRVLRVIPSEERQELYGLLEERLPVITAEAVYHYFMEESLEYQRLERLSGLFLSDDHSFWEKKKEEKDKKESEENRQQRDKWKEVSEKTKNTMETYFKSIGSGTGKLLELLKINQYKMTDYKELLKRFAVICEEMKTDLDSFDYGFYNYGMELYGNMPLIEELEYKEELRIYEFVIALDTSGSCSKALIREFLSETFSILKSQEIFGKKVNIHIIQCDDEIKEAMVLTSLDDIDRLFGNFQIKGHGGTDFRPVFAYVNRLIDEGKLLNLKGLLYFTDGYGIYPRVRPPYETAFIFKGDSCMEEEVPAWAIKAVLS